MTPVRQAATLPGRYLLACLDGQRRLRWVKADADLERWTRAWARRWYVVEASSVPTARDQVKRYLAACAIAGREGPTAREFGILESGKNAPGGPTAFPRATHGLAAGRSAPEERRRRHARRHQAEQKAMQLH